MTTSDGNLIGVFVGKKSYQGDRRTKASSSDSRDTLGLEVLQPAKFCSSVRMCPVLVGGGTVVFGGAKVLVD